MSITPNDILAALFESSVRAALFIVAIAVLLAVLRVRAGRVRHAAWTAGLVAMLLLPVLPKWLPVIPVNLQLPMPTAAATVVEPPAAANGRAQSAPATQTAAAPAPQASRTTLTQQQRPAPLASAPVDWSLILIAIWAIGALIMLTRLGMGWRYASRLSADSRALPEDPSLFESALVATPVTVGVFRPRIILPIESRAWPADVRETVLLHERAHIRRRDTLISILARFNRSVFWFHPLAWWLEQRIDVTAEQACDDVVVGAPGKPGNNDKADRYAALLVEMAAAVRSSGGRVAWEGVGMASGWSLDARIDRVLSGEAGRTMSRARQIVVALTCTAAIVLGVACQRTAPPLREDPEIAKRLAAQKANGEKYAAMRAITLDQIPALEAIVAKNPDDLETTEKLLVFYRENGQKTMGWNEMVAARRPHLLRLIERHPESRLTSWPFKQSLDPTGYAQARALWMKHVEKPDVTVQVLDRAVWFFRISEKPMAEQLLLRLQTMDPNGPQPRIVDNTYYSPWSSRLGELYARAIVGSDDETLFNVVRSVSLAEAHGPFATAAKKKLEASTDAALLRSAGGYLTQNTGRREDGTVGDQKIKLGFDHVALGESYLDRAALLDPNSEQTKTFEYYRKLQKAHNVSYEKRKAILGKAGWDIDDAAIAALSESDRFEVLPELATMAYSRGENSDHAKEDRAKYEAHFARAKKLADDTLALAEKFKNDPRYGAATYQAHVTRALVALREKDKSLALTHMKAATDGLKAGDDLDGETGFGNHRLGNYLLNWGERESVAVFYERTAAFLGPRGKQLLESAKAIREGKMPMGYQYSVTPH